MRRWWPLGVMVIFLMKRRGIGRVWNVPFCRGCSSWLRYTCMSVLSIDATS